MGVRRVGAIRRRDRATNLAWFRVSNAAVPFSSRVVFRQQCIQEYVKFACHAVSIAIRSFSYSTFWGSKPRKKSHGKAPRLNSKITTPTQNSNIKNPCRLRLKDRAGITETPFDF